MTTPDAGRKPGRHVPALSEHFMGLVVEWLMGHPKP